MPWYRATRVGAVWGLGHGVSASLIVIGLLGIKEAREWEAPAGDACEVKAVAEGGSPQSLSAAATPASSAAMAVNPNPAKRAVLFNGILHGFSWDGAPSLAPAVAISTWRGSLTFLLSYAVGTMGAMALATTLIGEGTRRAAGKLNRPDLPRDLSVGSSFLALLVGVVWCGLALR